MANSCWTVAPISPAYISPPASSSRMRRRTGSPRTSNACTLQYKRFYLYKSSLQLLVPSRRGGAPAESPGGLPKPWLGLGARRLPVEVRRQHWFRVGAFEQRHAWRGELAHRTVRRRVRIDRGLASHIERFGGQLRADCRELAAGPTDVGTAHRPSDALVEPVPGVDACRPRRLPLMLRNRPAAATALVLGNRFLHSDGGRCGPVERPVDAHLVVDRADDLHAHVVLLPRPARCDRLLVAHQGVRVLPVVHDLVAHDPVVVGGVHR